MRKVVRCPAHVMSECWLVRVWLEGTQSWVFFDSREIKEEAEKIALKE